MTTLTQPTGNFVVDARQRQQAGELFDALDGHPERLTVEGVPASAAHELVQVLVAALEVMAGGGTVVISSLPAELTTTVAAEQLGISRPTLMKLIAEGKLPARRVGTHHRVKLADVKEYRRKRLGEQRAAFAELSALSDQLDQL